MQQPWSRAWLVIDDTKLYFIRESGYTSAALEVQVVADTMLASVREAKFEGPFVFEVAYANKSTFTLQTEGPREYSAWVDAIRSAIEKRLVGGISLSPYLQVTSGGNSSLSLTNSSSAAVAAAASAAVMVGKRNDMVEAILLQNPTCAECGKKQPDWCSLNLGILICIGVCFCIVVRRLV